jgi:hypothetical protein
MATKRARFALSRASKIVRGLRQGLNEGDRYAVADHVVTLLTAAPTTQPTWCPASPRAGRAPP